MVLTAEASKRSGEALNNLNQADDRTVEGVHILGGYPVFEVGSASASLTS